MEKPIEWNVEEEHRRFLESVIHGPDLFEHRRIHAIVTRTADIAIGSVILTFGLPALLLIGLAVRFGSKGPALFVQRRVGRQLKNFALIKFRTMAVGTREAGTHEVMSHHVTSIGARLRHYKLDELPQAWNLVVGNLTLVGPRPCLPSQKALIEERERRGIYVLKPGLTGLAQVMGVDMSDPIRLAEIDEIYASKRRLSLDIKVLIRTLLGSGAGDRVAQREGP